jgi:excisionase family DNA binding protein
MNPNPQPSPPEPPMAYRIRDAVKTSGLGRSTLYRMIGDGRLPSVLVGGRRLIRHTDLAALIQNGSPQ